MSYSLLFVTAVVQHGEGEGVVAFADLGTVSCYTFVNLNTTVCYAFADFEKVESYPFAVLGTAV